MRVLVLCRGFSSSSQEVALISCKLSSAAFKKMFAVLYQLLQESEKSFSGCLLLHKDRKPSSTSEYPLDTRPSPLHWVNAIALRSSDYFPKCPLHSLVNSSTPRGAAVVILILSQRNRGPEKFSVLLHRGQNTNWRQDRGSAWASSAPHHPLSLPPTPNPCTIRLLSQRFSDFPHTSATVSQSQAPGFKMQRRESSSQGFLGWQGKQVNPSSTIHSGTRCRENKRRRRTPHVPRCLR